MGEPIQIQDYDLKRIYSSIDDLKERTGHLEKNQIESKVLLTQFISNQKEQTNTNKDLSQTMRNVEITMVEISQGLKSNTKDIEELKNEVVKINKDVKNDIEKNKIDMRDVSTPVAKQNLSKIYTKMFAVAITLLGLGGLVTLITVLVSLGKITSVIDNLQK